MSSETPLNQYQAGRLQVTLYLVEQALDEISGYLRGQLPRGEMYITVSDLTAEQQDDMLKMIGEIKQRITGIKNQFGLDTRTNDLRRTIMGYLGSVWESLHNTRPRNLSGFGTVAPELFETLEPELLKIIGLVDSMSSTLTRS
ncbi:MAG TPA: hypothetical protein VI837_12755 [Blastocatellia bacterium]|nr:hypothetical protein [Blastocatellia bacterium]